MRQLEHHPDVDPEDIELALMTGERLGQEQESAISSSSQPLPPKQPGVNMGNLAISAPSSVRNNSFGSMQGQRPVQQMPQSSQFNNAISKPIPSPVSINQQPRMPGQIGVQLKKIISPSSSQPQQSNVIRGQSPQLQMKQQDPRLSNPRTIGPQSLNSNQNIPMQNHSVPLARMPVSTNIGESINSPLEASQTSHVVGSASTPAQFAKPQQPPTRFSRPRQPDKFSQNPQQPLMQNAQNLNQPRFRAPFPQSTVQNQDSSISDAEMARRQVLSMQQSLDREIQQKKGFNPHQGTPLFHNSSTSQNIHSHYMPKTQQHLQPFNPAPQNLPPPPRLIHHHALPTQSQPTLPPRTPYPPTNEGHAANNPGGVTGGRPICSVVPFTNQTVNPVNKSINSGGPTKKGITPKKPGGYARAQRPVSNSQQQSIPVSTLAQQSNNQITSQPAGQQQAGMQNSQQSTQQNIQQTSQQNIQQTSQQNVHQSSQQNISQACLQTSQQSVSQMQQQSGQQNISHQPGQQNIPRQSVQQNIQHQPGKQNIPRQPGQQNIRHQLSQQNIPHQPGQQNIPHHTGQQNIQHHPGQQNVQHQPGQQNIQHQLGQQSMQHGQQNIQHQHIQQNIQQPSGQLNVQHAGQQNIQHQPVQQNIQHQPIQQYIQQQPAQPYIQQQPVQQYGHQQTQQHAQHYIQQPNQQYGQQPVQHYNQQPVQHYNQQYTQQHSQQPFTPQLDPQQQHAQQQPLAATSNHQLQPSLSSVQTNHPLAQPPGNTGSVSSYPNQQGVPLTQGQPHTGLVHHLPQVTSPSLEPSQG